MAKTTLGLLVILFFTCCSASAHWWNIKDDYEAAKKGFNSLLKKGESLADGVVRMGEDDIEKLKKFYHGDTDKLWDDVKGGFKSAKDELEAASKLGMNVFDKLSESAKDYLREMAQKIVASASTNPHKIFVRKEQPSPKSHTVYISSDVVNRANIIAFGGSDFSVRVSYKKINFDVNLFSIGDYNNVVNYNTVIINSGSKIRQVAIKQEIGQATHHYYGVNANVGSVTY